MTVRISAKRPKGEADGLQPWETELREMRESLVAVVLLYPRSLIDVLDEPDDPHRVVLGISQVEPLSGDEAMAAHSLMAGAFERRTGKQPLPFGMVWPEAEGEGEAE